MRVKLRDVRLSFPDLLEPSAYNPENKPDPVLKYGCHIVYEEGSDAHKEVEKAVKAVAKEKMGETWQKDFKIIMKSGKCFAMSDGEEKYGEGMLYASAKSKTKPKLKDDKNNDVTEDGVFYSGCYVHAIFDIYYTAKGGKKICAELKGVKFAKDGDAFGGGSPISDDEFAEFGSDDEDDDMDF